MCKHGGGAFFRTDCQKVVYGAVEPEHRYQYYDDGVLKHAQIRCSVHPS
ncbi:DUF6156 family protein [Methylobacter sp. Wu8]